MAQEAAHRPVSPNFRRVLHNQDVENTGNFSVFSRRVAQALLSLQEKNRYLPGLRFFVGFRQGYIEYRARPAGGRGKNDARETGAPGL